MSAKLARHASHVLDRRPVAVDGNSMPRNSGSSCATARSSAGRP